MLGILVGVFLLFSLLDRNGEYGAEQLMWLTTHRLQEFSHDPKSVPDQAFDALEKNFEAIIKRDPQSELALQAYLSIGRIYLVKRSYGIARQKIEEGLNRYPQRPDFCALALSFIGRTYELEEDLPQALRIYKRLVNEYPQTPVGLEMPLYIGQIYEREGAQAKAQTTYSQAIDHYRQLADEHPDSDLEIRSLRMLANTYIGLQKWQEAVDTLGEVLIKSGPNQYLDSSQVNLILRSINTISIVELKNYTVPKKIYKEYIRRHPQDGLSRVIKELIKGLNVLEKNSVKIQDKKIP